MGRTAAGEPRVFTHPAFQSACMFLGEFMCLIPYFSTYLRSKPRKPEGQAPRFRHESWSHKLKAMLAFALPALCDSAATTLLNIGLLLTYVTLCCLEQVPSSRPPGHLRLKSLYIRYAALQVCKRVSDAARHDGDFHRLPDGVVAPEAAAHPPLARHCAHHSRRSHCWCLKVLMFP